MHPKFIIACPPEAPLEGTFIYGMVYQHKDLVRERCYVRGGGWYHKDDINKVMTLYGSSGDFGSPRFQFLKHIPPELVGYRFTYSEEWGEPEHELNLRPG